MPVLNTVANLFQSLLLLSSKLQAVGPGCSRNVPSRQIGHKRSVTGMTKFPRDFPSPGRQAFVDP